MEDKLRQLKQEIIEQLAKVKDGQFLGELEIKYLGRKGEFTRFLRSVAGLSEEKRKTIGSL